MGEGTRTPDIQIHSLTLSPTELHPPKVFSQGLTSILPPYTTAPTIAATDTVAGTCMAESRSVNTMTVG